MRVGFDKVDFRQLVDLWRAFYPERYWVDEATLRFNTVDSHLFDWGASIVEMEDDRIIAAVAIKKSAAPLYRGPDPDQAHLSFVAFRQASAAVDLMSYAKKLLVNRGIFRIVFGADSRHFFPGCPTDAPSLRDFLIVEGFEAGDTVMDLERDLTTYAIDPNYAELLASYPGIPLPRLGLAEVRSVLEADRDQLRSFLEREFPGRWRYDAFSKIDLEESSDFIYGLWLDGGFEGFAVTQSYDCRYPIAGAIWKESMGTKWGALGPIGVSKAIRQKGLGGALLAGALMGLKQRGVERCIIDWTNLESFYGKHGFEPSRRYTPYSLELSPR